MINTPSNALTSKCKGATIAGLITFASGSGFLLFGYDQGVFGGLLTAAPFEKRFPSMTDPNLQGTVTAIYEIGCFFGAIATFFVGEKLGRRRCILLGMTVLAIGAVLQASSYTVAQLIVGRIVTGAGNGMTTSAIPVWNSECSKASDRGKAVCWELAITIFGVMTAYWVDYGMSYVANEAQFRAPLAIQIIFAFVTFVLVLFLPESPRWLVAVGRTSEAAEVLRMLSRESDDAREKEVETELQHIIHAVEEERKVATGSLWDCFKMGKTRNLHRVSLGIGGQLLQQISGINLITYFAPVIFQKSVGLSRNTSLLLSGFNGVAYFLSSLVPIPLIERLGRRKLLLASAVGQFICMAVLAGTTKEIGNKAAGIAASAMLFLFNFFFSLGFLAIPWLYPAEISPLPIRSKSAALATASNWIFTFLVVEITPIAISHIAWRTYVIWTVTNFVFIFIVYFFYVETMGLALEDVDELFENETSWVIGPKSAKVAADIRRRAKAADSPRTEHESEKGGSVQTIEHTS